MKKRILTLFALAVVTMGAWADPIDNTKDWWIMDENWSYVGIFPATNGETSVTYIVGRGVKVKSGNGLTKFPTNEYVATAGNGGAGFIDTATSIGILKLTMSYAGKTVLTVEQAESLPLTVGTAKVATLCAPADLTIPIGVKAYTLKYNGSDKLVATEVTGTIPANTPVLINAEPDDYSFTIKKETTHIETGTYEYVDLDKKTKSRTYIKDVTSTDNHLQGVLQMHCVPTGSYVLQNGKNGLGFYNVGETADYRINQFRCYVTLPAADPEARSLSIVFDDSETTGIADVKGQKEDVRSDIFNLSGQRVGKDYKGVVIKNGRKMIQK